MKVNLLGELRIELERTDNYIGLWQWGRSGAGKSWRRESNLWLRRCRGCVREGLRPGVVKVWLRPGWTLLWRVDHVNRGSIRDGTSKVRVLNVVGLLRLWQLLVLMLLDVFGLRLRLRHMVMLLGLLVLLRLLRLLLFFLIVIVLRLRLGLRTWLMNFLVAWLRWPKFL